jgi:hypothetical protein
MPEEDILELNMDDSSLEYNREREGETLNIKFGDELSNEN